MEDAAAAGAKKPPPRAPPAVTPWSTGLFGCLEDRENCLVTLVCPCIPFGQVAEVVDGGSTSSGASAALYMLLGVVTGSRLPWVYSCTYRRKMRAQYGLQESPLPDCLVHFLCEPCAICQEYRELRNRGFDMDVGWHANMESRGSAPATVPPTMHADGMTR